MAEPGGPGGLLRPGRGRVRDPSLGISPQILPHPPPPARARGPEWWGGDLEGRGIGRGQSGLSAEGSGNTPAHCQRGTCELVGPPGRKPLSLSRGVLLWENSSHCVKG